MIYPRDLYTSKELTIIKKSITSNIKDQNRILVYLDTLIKVVKIDEAKTRKAKKNKKKRFNTLGLS